MRRKTIVSATPIKVVIAGPALKNIGGVANYVSNLVHYTNQNEVQFTIIEVGKSHHTSSMARRPFEYTASAWRLTRALRRIQPDVIHFNPSLNWKSLSLYLLLFFCAKLFSNAALLVFFRGWDDHIAEKLSKQGLMSRILRLTLGATNQVLVLASSFKNQLIAGGIAASKISVSSVMVPTENFKNSFPLNTGAKDAFKVLFLSRIVREKGIWTLLEAAEQIIAKKPEANVKYIIAGDGPEKDRVERYVLKQGWQEFFQFTGFVHGIAKYELFREADLFAFPTVYPEGFPNVVVEALAAGLPIIYAPVGALREVLSHENGIMIEIDQMNGSTLSLAILELYDKSTFRKQISAANRKLAEEKYDVSHVCQQIVDTYKKILIQHKSQINSHESR